MDTLATLDPQAQFVLGGHSSSGRAVADATLDQLKRYGNSGNRIRELLLFDPHIIYPQGKGPSTPFDPQGVAKITAPDANIEISLFQADVKGTPYAYDGNQSLWPYPKEWEAGDNVRYLPLPDNTSADLRHYWIVGNMGADGAAAAAGSATTRRPRTPGVSPTAGPTATPGMGPTPGAGPGPGTGDAPVWPATAPASGTGTVQIVDQSGAKTLRMHQTPPDGPLVANIPEGAKVTIQAKTTIPIGPGISVATVWYLVNYNSQTGWVSASYIKLQ